jgi:hypothetical protein
MTAIGLAELLILRANRRGSCPWSRTTRRSTPKLLCAVIARLLGQKQLNRWRSRSNVEASCGDLRLGASQVASSAVGLGPPSSGPTRLAPFRSADRVGAS